jgi:hypothetical protein
MPTTTLYRSTVTVELWTHTVRLDTSRSAP